ncbi:MAG TPA: glyceraldehyde 3-phosphate dehydrogenase NAD-binding domain-containing protein, partial [Longimicrobiales bacterium]|nr:glyceraldehyde 3-phosphate dehydrogenase NAD-binding domain-containing protein [Longimicrobiales bacterium]
MTRVAINGFGRIGRLVFRHFMEEDGFEVVAVNDIADPANLAYLLRRDSVHADPGVEVAAGDGELRWGDRSVRFLSERDPTSLPWKEMDVEIAVEATGLFTKRDDAAKHLEAGADRALISAPGKGVDLTVCMGVNEDVFDPEKHRVVSNASCTTN